HGSLGARSVDQKAWPKYSHTQVQRFELGGKAGQLKVHGSLGPALKESLEAETVPVPCHCSMG
ncbi:unnamed protein product, partial [Heterosigma akashiwo]